MKLVSVLILLMHLEIYTKAQNLQELMLFPPQLQSSGNIFSSDSSLYLPPESYTSVPYITKNNNKVPFQYLPPTGTKLPTVYPSPFPMLFSSTIVPSFDDDGEENENYDKNKHSSSSQTTNIFNRTEKAIEDLEIKETVAVPRDFNYHAIDRIDKKFSFPYSGFGSIKTSPINQTPAARRTITSTETQIPEQITKNSYVTAPHIPMPSGAYISSTTEPAIPILRLTNEMDLDGSFSYEALGADQTHYVQNSRMENVGTDKEEQVVEGSYSYVGDNGQTYTVHYIADSNGFRASGDHLPVPPPIPAIIQRAIQYNQAEEAQKSSQLKSRQEEEKNHEIMENDHSNHYNVQPFRNLFTGKTPEAFSYRFSEGSDQQNNLITPAIAQSAIRSSTDFPNDQTQANANNRLVSPQVTFLASQGAHVPSLDSAQQSISRMFTTEKSTLPQLINYEANIKELEQENNKALWRWQYGLNTHQANQNSNKNAISRSFSEGDDVMINFSDMTPEQYTKMIHEQLTPTVTKNSEIFEGHRNYSQTEKNNRNKYYEHAIKNEDVNIQKKKDDEIIAIDSKSFMIPDSKDWLYKNQESTPETGLHQKNEEFSSTEKNQLLSRLKIRNVMLPSQIVTQSYDYEDDFYESKEMKQDNKEIKNASVIISKPDFDKNVNNIWSSPNQFVKDIQSTTQQSTQNSIETKLKFTDFIVNEDNQNFKPITNIGINKRPEQETTTETFEEMLRNNIFFSNLFETDKNKNYYENRSHQEYNTQIKKENELRTDKVPKFMQLQSKSISEIKDVKKKPLNMSEIFNYLTLKNNFESIKLKPKSKPINTNNLNQINEVRYIPVQQQEKTKITFESNPEQSANIFKPFNQSQEELQGMIRNYKILQRNNINNMNKEKYSNILERKLSPPPIKLLQTQNLPPLGRAGPAMKSYLPPIYVN